MKTFMLPRIMWMNKEWTLKQVYLEIFKFYKQLFIDWYTQEVPPFRVKATEKEVGRYMNK